VLPGAQGNAGLGLAALVHAVDRALEILVD
jgi:hypothetical protein